MIIATAEKEKCFRKALFAHFENKPTSVEPGHLCCTFCHSLCSCAGDACCEPTPNYELVESETEVCAELKSREVTDEDKATLKDLLEEYMASLTESSARLFTNKSASTGFSSVLIKEVLKHSANIFDLAYILEILPVFGSQHGREILIIFNEVFRDVEIDFEPCSAAYTLAELDLNYTGYFDDDEEFSDMATPHSSPESEYFH